MSADTITPTSWGCFGTFTMRLPSCSCPVCTGPRQRPCRPDQHRWAILHGRPTCTRCHNTPDVDAVLGAPFDLEPAREA
jgi:hypothetical protein